MLTITGAGLFQYYNKYYMIQEHSFQDKGQIWERKNGEQKYAPLETAVQANFVQAALLYRVGL